MKYKKEIEEIMSLTNKAHDILNMVIAGLDENESELNLDSFCLEPEKNFQSFIEGDSNKIARKVGLSIAEKPALNIYNPFFIYGPSGCGKSHLINAIGLKFREINPNKRVLYVSAQQFQRQFTDSVRQNTTNDFIDMYQAVDVLIVDDVHEWMKSPKTLETFIQIFNYLICTGKQIIIASDRPPVELKGIKRSVLTRFASGLIAELEPPNEQLCIDILNTKYNHENQKVPAEVIEFIAKTANSSVYELEGVVNSLMAYSTINNTDIDIPLAKRVVMRSVKLN
jgi:chromosomal replication initiator protein